MLEQRKGEAAMRTNEPVLYKEKSGVAVITLNRPDVLNAIDPGVLQRVGKYLDIAQSSETVKAVMLTGAGMAFSAGADIRYLNRATPMEVRDFARLAVRITNRIEDLGKPTVAVLNGHTFGGGLELAESCMIRIAASHAKLGHPEVRIGAVAGFGGTTRLPRLVGKGRAAEMLLRGRAVDAEEALRIGLVQFVAQADRLMDEAEAVVRDILAQSPAAVRLTWEAVHRGLNMTLEESADLGADFFGLVAATEDFRTGTQAFVDKGTPVYVER
jgi:enoyl-CoA hydratase